MPGPQDVRAGRAFVEVGIDDKLSAGLDRIASNMRRTGSQIEAVGRSIAAAGFGGIAGLTAAVGVFEHVGSALQQLQAKTGGSIESLSTLGFAARQTGVSAEALELGLTKMQRSIYDAATGSAKATEGLSRLGLTLGQLQGLSADKQLGVVADAINRLPAGDRAGAAFEVMGRNAAELLPLLDGGSAGIDRLTGRAAALGIVVGGPAAAAAILRSRLSELGDVTESVAFKVGAALAPAVGHTAEQLSTAVAAAGRWVEGHQGVVIAAAGAAVALAGLGGALIGTGLAMRAVAPVFSLAATGVRIVGSAVSAAAGLIASSAGLVARGFTLIPSAAVLAYRSISTIGTAAIALVNPMTYARAAVAAFNGTVLAIQTVAGVATTAYEGIGAAAALAFAPEFLVGAAVVGAAGAFLYLSGAAGAAWAAVKSSAGSAGDYTESVFGRVGRTLATTWATVRADAELAFGGLRNAIEAGDWSLAGRTIIDAIRLEVDRGALKVFSGIELAYKSLMGKLGQTAGLESLGKIDAAARKAVDDATARLQADADKAAAEHQAAKDADAKKTPPGGLAGNGDANGAVPGGGGEARSGTFNHLDLFGFGGGTTYNQRIADATEKTAANTDPSKASKAAATVNPKTTATPTPAPTPTATPAPTPTDRPDPGKAATPPPAAAHDAATTADAKPDRPTPLPQPESHPLTAVDAAGLILPLVGLAGVIANATNRTADNTAAGRSTASTPPSPGTAPANPAIDPSSDAARLAAAEAKAKAVAERVAVLALDGAAEDRRLLSSIFGGLASVPVAAPAPVPPAAVAGPAAPPVGSPPTVATIPATVAPAAARVVAPALPPPGQSTAKAVDAVTPPAVPTPTVVLGPASKPPPPPSPVTTAPAQTPPTVVDAYRRLQAAEARARATDNTRGPVRQSALDDVRAAVDALRAARSTPAAPAALPSPAPAALPSPALTLAGQSIAKAADAVTAKVKAAPPPPVVHGTPIPGVHHYDRPDEGPDTIADYRRAHPDAAKEMDEDRVKPPDHVKPGYRAAGRTELTDAKDLGDGTYRVRSPSAGLSAVVDADALARLRRESLRSHADDPGSNRTLRAAGDACAANKAATAKYIADPTPANKAAADDANHKLRDLADPLPDADRTKAYAGQLPTTPAKPEQSDPKAVTGVADGIADAVRQQLSNLAGATNGVRVKLPTGTVDVGAATSKLATGGFNDFADLAQRMQKLLAGVPSLPPAARQALADARRNAAAVPPGASGTGGGTSDADKQDAYRQQQRMDPKGGGSAGAKPAGHADLLEQAREQTRMLTKLADRPGLTFA